MDTELLRTFLEINRTRHFGRAASNLYLTQSAVSARMRLLEQSVGLQLFTRERNDIQLTPSGRKFLPHAEAIVERWAQAQQEIALHEEERARLHVGSQLAIAELIFPKWTRLLWEQMPDLSLNVEVIASSRVIPRLEEDTLDLIVTYGPTGNPDFKDTKVGELSLQLMSTDESTTVSDVLGSANYVHMEWGSWFDVAFAKSYPNLVPGGLRTGSIHLIVDLLADQDGACYLPADIDRQMKAVEIELYPVKDAETLESDVIVSYPLASPNRGLIEETLHILRDHSVID